MTVNIFRSPKDTDPVWEFLYTKGPTFFGPYMRDPVFKILAWHQGSYYICYFGSIQGVPDFETGI